MDMPKKLDDIRMLSREYMKNLGVTDDIADEQVYLQYIEDHLQNQERSTAHDMGMTAGTPLQSEKRNAHLSPIRNLAEFYQRKLNKIQSHTYNNESSYMHSANASQMRSPKRTA